MKYKENKLYQRNKKVKLYWKTKMFPFNKKKIYKYKVT